METARLRFVLGDPDRGHKLISHYRGRTAVLCGGEFCFSCDYEEREKLEDFDEGELNVALQLKTRSGPFGDQIESYIAHLVNVPEPEKKETIISEKEEETREFGSADDNTILYVCGDTRILVDPGKMSLVYGDKKALQELEPTAVKITHPHEDHWRDVTAFADKNIVFYISSLTYRLIVSKIRMSGGIYATKEQVSEARLLQKVLRKTRIIDSTSQITIGEAKVYTFPVPHTVRESNGLLIVGNGKRVLHLGDFRLGEGEEKAELITTLRAIARRKIDLLTLCGVNAHIEADNVTESAVIDSLADIMLEAPGRVIVSCFSTSLDRIREISKVAQAQERGVCFVGYSMKRAYYELLRSGDIEENNGDPNSPRALIFASGHQAEPYSVLQMAVTKRHEKLQLRPSDALNFSARAIPGDEEDIRKLLEAALPLVGKIYLHRGEPEVLGLPPSPKIVEAITHSSGHENGPGIKRVLADTRPESIHIVPKEGKGADALRKMAKEMGIKVFEGNIFDLG